MPLSGACWRMSGSWGGSFGEAEHSITQLSGKAKAAGKTSFLLALGRSVLTGSDFIGQATTGGPVVYLTEERLPSFHAALQRAGLIERHDLHIVSFGDLADTSWPGICRLAKAQCAQVNAKLLVIDTLSQFGGFTGEQENNSGDANTALAPLQQIAHHLPLAVIVVRHDRKSGGAVGDAARGSGQFTAGVDIVLHLGPREGRGEPTQRELTAMSRFEETPQALVIDRIHAAQPREEVWAESNGYEYVALGEPGALAHRQVENAVLEMLPLTEGEALSLGDITSEIEATRGTLQRVLKTLVARGDLTRCGAGRRGSPHRYFKAVVSE